jgi:hypothetical protein
MARALAILFLISACSPSKPLETAPVQPAAPVPEVALDPKAAMNAATDALMARAEHEEPMVTVQHCLIAVEGVLPGVTRSVAEAETITADLWTRVQAGADFARLVSEHGEDPFPATYTLSLGEPPTEDVLPREAMTLALGDVAWRLAVGEVGVMRYDGERFDVEARSPFGYHLVKRLE